MPSLKQLPQPVAVAAFAGWNDAGGAATDAVVFLSGALNAQKWTVIPPDDYCDFQVNRPQVRMGEDGKPAIVWPSTELLEAEQGDSRIMLIGGIEPSIHWRAYARELLDCLSDWGATSLITVGALLADVPHTRETPVQVGASDPELRQAMDLDRGNYEGPVGIPTIVGDLAEREYGLTTVSLWAAVPHYVGNPPVPKATLALVETLSGLTNVNVHVSELRRQSVEWQAQIDRMAAVDSDVSSYVSRLEKAKDTLDSAAGSGEVLAKEFEKYLRRRDQ